MEWISVKDRLPSVGEDILFYHKGGFCGVGQLMPGREGVYEWLWWGEIPRCLLKSNCITHWMPLPEPPKLKRKYSYEPSGIHDNSGYVVYAASMITADTSFMT